MIVDHSNHERLQKGQKVWPFHNEDQVVVGEVKIVKPDITFYPDGEMSIEGFCYLKSGDENAKFIIVFLKEG